MNHSSPGARPGSRRIRSLSAVALAAVTATALAACGSSSSASGTNASAKAGSGSGDKTLHIYAWAGEVPNSLVKAFEKSTGISVTVATTTSNEAMIAKLANGGASGYDVVEPSQYAVQELTQQKLILPLDHSKLSGLDNIAASYRNASYDEGAKYSIPWLTGSTGLIYNSKCTGGPVDSWSTLWNPKFKGKLYMLDNELSAYIPALQVNGYRATSTNQAQIAKATQSLVTQKPLLAGYNSTNYAQLVQSGQACAAEAYSGGTSAAAVEANPDVHYILPKEGGTIWVDTFSIVKGTQNMTAAYKWLNFILEPKEAAMAARSAQEATANQAAYKYIPVKERHNPAIYTPLAAIKHADFILNPGKALTYFNQGWLKVRAGA
ncbi:MAG TPA: spermidine/putrescine ABC transporter substrate-binding protein [Acidimicrobiales bacterium]|jgi:spermidine/putrescine transport system substrate-binding protein